MTIGLKQIENEKWYIGVECYPVQHLGCLTYKVIQCENCGSAAEPMWYERKRLFYGEKSKAMATFRRWKKGTWTMKSSHAEHGRLARFDSLHGISVGNQTEKNQIAQKGGKRLFMLNTEKVIGKLANEGIKAEVVTVMKNGVEKTGLTLGEGTTRPTLYIDGIEDEDEIITIVKKTLANGVPDIDLDGTLTPDYVKANTILTVQRPSTENIEKLDYLDIEVVPKIMIKVGADDMGTIKFTDKLMKTLDLCLDDIMSAGLENDKFEVRKISEIIPVPDTLAMWVVTRTTNVHGAAALCHPEIFRNFCQEHEVDKVTILPSSIHELILTTADDEQTSSFAQMVHEVNASAVSPEERMNETVYEYSLEADKVTIAATY